MKNRTEAGMLASLKKKETYEHYLETLKFALYCITHPLDGFWDFTHRIFMDLHHG